MEQVNYVNSVHKELFVVPMERLVPVPSKVGGEAKTIQLSWNVFRRKLAQVHPQTYAELDTEEYGAPNVSEITIALVKLA